jgi:hypothetical protein
LFYIEFWRGEGPTNATLVSVSLYDLLTYPKSLARLAPLAQTREKKNQKSRFEKKAIWAIFFQNLKMAFNLGYQAEVLRV